MTAASRRLAALLVPLAILMTGPSQADPVAGQSDPDFTAAVDQWLAGDEAAALPRLGRLAQGDNPAAQILLGLIDTTPALQGDWLMALPRQDRIGLLREPGGLSGQNWMRAATAEPLARAWTDLWNGDATHAVILDFARLGEMRAARVAAMTLAKRERTGFAAIADDPAYPAAARAFALREWQRTDPARAAQEAAALTAGDPQAEVLGLTTDQPAATATWLANGPEGAPLVALCAVACPAVDQPACLAAAYQATGGYWTVMRMGSPVEAIIPSDRFNSSQAGRDSVLRQMQGGATGQACLDAARE
jgi:hypothetical protein